MAWSHETVHEPLFDYEHKSKRTERGREIEIESNIMIINYDDSIYQA